MNKKLYEHFSYISEEEQGILEGKGVQRAFYTDSPEFVVDYKNFIKPGEIIGATHHTRFTYFPMHGHNYIEVLYEFCGSTTHILGNGERIELKQGDLMFLNKNAKHEILPAAENDILINLLVLPEFFDTAFRMLESEDMLQDYLINILIGQSEEAYYLYFKARDELPVQNLLENILWGMIHEDKNHQVIEQNTMGLLFMYLISMNDRIHYVSENSYEQECVLKVYSYIESNYRTAMLSELCAQLCQSPSALSKFIQKQTGSTFKELLLSKRMSTAANLLTRTRLSVDDIIAAVGYENTSYFFRTFKSRFGMSPKEYRNKG